MHRWINTVLLIVVIGGLSYVGVAQHNLKRQQRRIEQKVSRAECYARDIRRGFKVNLQPTDTTGGLGAEKIGSADELDGTANGAATTRC